MRKTSLVLILIVAALLVFGIVACVWLAVPSVPPVVLPNPNGYEKFVASTRKVVGTPDDVTSSDSDTLKQFLIANAAVLNESLDALQLECVVPVEYTAAYQQRLADDAGPLKNVARLLWADARLAELEGRLDEAALKYAEVIRFSQNSSNGGLLLHLQSGIAYERLGWEALLRLAPSLSTEQKAALRTQLASMNPSSRKVEDYMAREKALAAATQGRLMVFIMSNASGVNAGEEDSRMAIKEMQDARDQVMKALSE